MGKVTSLISNKSGFSLVELVIVSGLLGILIAASGSIILNLQKTMNGLNAQQELTSLSSEVQGRMIAEKLCTPSIVPANKFQNFSLTQASALSSSANAGMPFSFLLANGESIQANQTLLGYPFLVESFELYDAQIVDSSPLEQTYMANVVGRFKYNRSVNGPSEFQRNFGTLFIKVNNSNQITNCSKTDLSLSGRDCKACGINNTISTLIMQNQTCSPPGVEMIAPEGSVRSKIVSCPSGQANISTICINGEWRSIGTCGKDNN